MLPKAQHGTSLRPLLSIIDTFRHVERLLEECERLLLVFEEPATSIAAESFVLAECPKCDRERALTQDYRLAVNAAERSSIISELCLDLDDQIRLKLLIHVLSRGRWVTPGIADDAGHPDLVVHAVVDVAMNP